MNWVAPERVLITGGHELGGVGSFAEGLSSGFTKLGIQSEIIPPSRVWSRWRDLRDERVLKVLSTTGMLAVPFARRTISMVHGIPFVPDQGWSKTSVLLACWRMTNACSHARLISVSDYIAVHMEMFFNLRVDTVIRNPIKPIFLEQDGEQHERQYITYVGRLVSYKNMHRILPAILDLLNEHPDLRACIIGDGPARTELQKMAAGNPRVEFKGNPGDQEVRHCLRRTKVFVSGHTTEGFGITYLEALSQGCVVAMPASGGGVEIALPRVGDAVQLLPISLDRREVLEVFRRALKVQATPISMEPYSPAFVASAYLEVDRCFLYGTGSLKAANARVV